MKLSCCIYFCVRFIRVKPRWQGPLGEDSLEEESPAAIHIFESKIPTVRRSKSSVKSAGGDPGSQTVADKPELTTEVVDDRQQDKKSVEAKTDENVDVPLANGFVDQGKDKKRKMEHDKPVSRLRLSRNKPAVDDPVVVSALEEAVADHRPQLERELESVRQNVERLTRSPKLSDNWNPYQMTPTGVKQMPHSPPVSDNRRGTFDIMYPTRDSPQRSFSSEINERKRQQSSSQKVATSPLKKVCRNKIAESVIELQADNISMENALKKMQEQLSVSQKEGKDQDWLKSLMKPDGFSMMNVIKMKTLSCQKRDSSEKRERLKQKVLSARCSLEDETDAPSISSMEEDFQILPEPLRLSEIHLPMPNRSSTGESLPWSPQSSGTSLANRKATDESMKTTSSLYTCEAPPLVIPESVQHLRLKSTRSHSDLSSTSQIMTQYGSDNVLTLSSFEKKRPVSPVHSSSSKASVSGSASKHSSQERAQRAEPEQFLRLKDGQIEIGQVLASPPSHGSNSGKPPSVSEHLVSEHLPTLVTRSLDSVPISANSSFHSVEEISQTQVAESCPKVREGSQQLSLSPPHVLSHMLSPNSLSAKDIIFMQMMINDAEFHRQQHQFWYKTQEEILEGNYHAALSDLEVRFRGITDPKAGVLKSESDARAKIEEHYRTTLANIRETGSHVLSNWNRRIEDLVKQRDYMKKQLRNKPNNIKLKSSEASPKKLISLRSTSGTSVMESSSSSESSVMTQTFDDKKRQEVEKEKPFTFNQKKVQKELLRSLQEEARKASEIEKVERPIKPGRSRRDRSTSPLESVLESATKDTACSVQEDHDTISQQVTSSLQSVEEVRVTDVYNSESFESPESSETPRHPKMINRPALTSRPFVAARANKSKVLIKVPLSPRLQLRSKKRCSSGSDESLLLSQNETQSEQSDYEVKIAALKEQKRQRCAELSRLQRELKRAQREQLKATEAALIKQIEVYDSYILQTKKQLEEVSSTMIVRPQIKHPRVSDKFLPRKSDIVQRTSIIEIQTNDQEAHASDVETSSLKSVSEASSTETTIQSIGQALATEQSLTEGKQKTVLRAGSDATEVLSSVTSEETSGLKTLKSDGSEVSDRTEEASKSVISDVVDEQWMDAAVFFKQLGQPDDTLNGKSVEESLPLATSETNVSQILTNISESVPEDGFLDQVQSERVTDIESEERVSSEMQSETPQDDFSPTKNENESSSNKSVEEESSVPISTKDVLEGSENLDIGSVVSIISQAPSLRSPVSGSGSQNGAEHELNSSLHNSGSGSKPESDVFPSDDDNFSTTTGDKSAVSEAGLHKSSHSNEPSVSSDVQVTSQYYSEEEETDSVSIPNSDLNENFESSHSGVIKVFVSNKSQVVSEEVIEDGASIKLNDSYEEPLDDREEAKLFDASCVDIITDDILNSLLNECFTDKSHKDTHVGATDSTDVVMAEKDSIAKSGISVDDFTKTVLNKFLQDATECMLRINESKKKATSNCSKFTSNIEEKNLIQQITSNQLLDALALEGSGSPPLEKRVEGSPSRAKSTSSEVEFNDGSESEVFWFDEDLHPVNLQTQREAEELRLKQLQIEQEIKQLEQAQESSIPSYYYVREIPNKPPPPYTPPGQPRDSLDRVPTRQEDIESLVTMATQSLVTAWTRAEDLTIVQPSEQYSTKRVGSQVYKKFLFDLVKQIFIDVTSKDVDEKDIPPWERTGCRMKQVAVPKLSEESVSKFVLKKVRVLFGFESNSIKENLIIQWSRKKRDRVDELLVRESQEEEREWTDYSKCEVAVKNNVALSIFDSLLDETALALSNAFQNKLQYCQQAA